jgi:Protein of unknown function (DUF3179)
MLSGLVFSARRSRVAVAALALAVSLGAALANPDGWRAEWPRTDFSKHTVSFAEIKSGGPRRDGIPPIDHPRFEQLAGGKPSGWAARLADVEPVISLAVGDDARAYPLRVLTWHEIVNDVVGERPVAVTYCPLCNTAIVFDRTSDGQILDFGTTGKLRHSDLVMYDRQSESWWQQFTGEAIVGTRSGQKLRILPSRLESFARFRERHPDGRVLVPNNPAARNYGANPYVGYDATGRRPFLYDGTLPEGIEPMERVVAVETAAGRHEAWALSLLRRQGRIEHGDLVLKWEAGQASALDKSSVAAGRDVGNVIVQRRQGDTWVDVSYDVTFAFAFHAFRPGGPMHKAETVTRSK